MTQLCWAGLVMTQVCWAVLVMTQPCWAGCMCPSVRMGMRVCVLVYACVLVRTRACVCAGARAWYVC